MGSRWPDSNRRHIHAHELLYQLSYNGIQKRTPDTDRRPMCVDLIMI